VSALRYTGRFAPSPTGPLHFGSAVAAIASYLDARYAGGRWLVRIDDIDPPREQPGAAASILASLSALGLQWDGEVTYQSDAGPRYEAALRTLERSGWTFPCGCTRRDLAGGVYPGTCRHGLPAGRDPRTVRIRVGDGEIQFADRIAGMIVQPASAAGDFVLLRADGYYAYHLACVVDDAAAGITHVVRGIDLLDSTPRQIYLQQCLQLATPVYAHFPVVRDRAGTKLSKQTFAEPIDNRAAPLLVHDALNFLRQSPPPDMRGAPVRELLAWATAHWRMNVLAAPARKAD